LTGTKYELVKKVRKRENRINGSRFRDNQSLLEEELCNTATGRRPF